MAEDIGSGQPRISRTPQTPAFFTPAPLQPKPTNFTPAFFTPAQGYGGGGGSLSSTPVPTQSQQAVELEKNLAAQAKVGGGSLPLSKERILAATQGRDISQNLSTQAALRNAGYSLADSKRLAGEFDRLSQNQATALANAQANPYVPISFIDTTSLAGLTQVIKKQQAPSEEARVVAEIFPNKRQEVSTISVPIEKIGKDGYPVITFAKQNIIAPEGTYTIPELTTTQTDVGKDIFGGELSDKSILKSWNQAQIDLAREDLSKKFEKVTDIAGNIVGKGVASQAEIYTLPLGKKTAFNVGMGTEKFVSSAAKAYLRFPVEHPGITAVTAGAGELLGITGEVASSLLGKEVVKETSKYGGAIAGGLLIGSTIPGVIANPASIPQVLGESAIQASLFGAGFKRGQSLGRELTGQNIQELPIGKEYFVPSGKEKTAANLRNIVKSVDVTNLDSELKVQLEKFTGERATTQSYKRFFQPEGEGQQPFILGKGDIVTLEFGKTLGGLKEDLTGSRSFQALQIEDGKILKKIIGVSIEAPGDKGTRFLTKALVSDLVAKKEQLFTLAEKTEVLDTQKRIFDIIEKSKLESRILKVQDEQALAQIRVDELKQSEINLVDEKRVAKVFNKGFINLEGEKIILPSELRIPSPPSPFRMAKEFKGELPEFKEVPNLKKLLSEEISRKSFVEEPKLRAENKVLLDTIKESIGKDISARKFDEHKFLKDLNAIAKQDKKFLEQDLFSEKEFKEARIGDKGLGIRSLRTEKVKIVGQEIIKDKINTGKLLRLESRIKERGLIRGKPKVGFELQAKRIEVPANYVFDEKLKRFVAPPTEKELFIKEFKKNLAQIEFEDIIARDDRIAKKEIEIENKIRNKLDSLIQEPQPESLGTSNALLAVALEQSLKPSPSRAFLFDVTTEPVIYPRTARVPPVFATLRTARARVKIPEVSAKTFIEQGFDIKTKQGAGLDRAFESKSKLDTKSELELAQKFEMQLKNRNQLESRLQLNLKQQQRQEQKLLQQLMTQKKTRATKTTLFPPTRQPPEKKKKFGFLFDEDFKLKEPKFRTRRLSKGKTYTPSFAAIELGITQKVSKKQLARLSESPGIRAIPFDKQDKAIARLLSI